MEPLSAALTTFGIAILAASWIMLIIASFREDFTWGLSSVFVPPFAYFYGLFKWQKAQEAILFAVLGWVLIFLA
jgi:hypothetical protein